MAWHHYISGKYDDDCCLSKSQSNQIAQFTSLRAVNGEDGAAGGSHWTWLALRIIYIENNSIAILAHKANDLWSRTATVWQANCYNFSLARNDRKLCRPNKWKRRDRGLLLCVCVSVDLGPVKSSAFSRFYLWKIYVGDKISTTTDRTGPTWPQLQPARPEAQRESGVGGSRTVR